MPTINPYLTFDGNCEEAFNFYKSVFGNDFSDFNKFKDMPPTEGVEISEAELEKIMHVSLPIGENNMLMGSDTAKAFDSQKVVNGNNFSISIQADNREETEKIFTQLSEGGKVIIPLNDTFWGAYFGMLIDKFGIRWMIDCENK